MNKRASASQADRLPERVPAGTRVKRDRCWDAIPVTEVDPSSAADVTTFWWSLAVVALGDLHPAQAEWMTSGVGVDLVAVGGVGV